ncbi:hypothetical protein ACT3WW_12970, partial [Brucella abortus]
MRQIDSSLGEAGETKNPAVRALIAAGLSQGNPGGAGSQGSVANYSDLLRYASGLCMVEESVQRMAIDFKGAHFPKNVILYAVFFY